MHIETTVILTAEEGKLLRNKLTGIETPSVWLQIGDSQENWEEIDDLPEEPSIEELPVEDPSSPENP